MGEDVVDLADRDDRPPGIVGAVQQRRLGRQYGVILAVAGALEIGGRFADEGPGDHAADHGIAHRAVENGAGDLAHLVEPLQPEMPFMRGDLQHGIRGGVADRLAGADVLRAKLGDDVRARGMLVAENAGQPCLAHQSIGESGRERSARSWGSSPSRTAPARRKFPNVRTACPCPWKPRWRCSGQRMAGSAGQTRRAARRRHCARRNPSPSRSRLGKCNGPERRPSRVAAAVHASSGDVAERVGAHVAELGRIGRAACPDRVEHEQECPRHCCNFLTKNVP